jgi:hypothetical protein
MCAQSQAPAPTTYTDAKGRYQLAYPGTWQLRKDANGAEVTLYASAARPAPALVTLTSQVLPPQQKDLKLTLSGGQDSLWRAIQRLPRPRVLGLSQQDFGSYEEVRYDTLVPPRLPGRAASTCWGGGCGAAATSFS